ncbi:class I SAM-dependent methyltransferase [Clostridium intestinale]|uniref:class I SAM-dependent methyltransferase n=1 Tax=Clostridium intestinale TaxID=36845 RepID=UPI0028E4AC47|nr:class I SAM-dependent methyltransferase [Clostridium intestinale]
MEDEILKFYHEFNDESERLESNPGRVEFITTMAYLNKVIPKNSSILDACAGAGKYAFALAKEGHSIVAGDLVDINVNMIREQQKGTPLLNDIYEGSILDLSRFKDESFDVVLNFGAYYHICDDGKREKSTSESLRVLKKGGIYALAYINRYANFYGHAEEMLLDFDMFEYYMQNGHLENSNLFYASSPEMVENEMKNFNLKQLYNIASDGPVFYIRDTLNKMPEDTFDRYVRMHLSICENRSTLGISEHGLFIGRK